MGKDGKQSFTSDSLLRTSSSRLYCTFINHIAHIAIKIRIYLNNFRWRTTLQLKSSLRKLSVSTSTDVKKLISLGQDAVLSSLLVIAYWFRNNHLFISLGRVPTLPSTSLVTPACSRWDCVSSDPDLGYPNFLDLSTWMRKEERIAWLARRLELDDVVWGSRCHGKLRAPLISAALSVPTRRHVRPPPLLSPPLTLSPILHRPPHQWGGEGGWNGWSRGPRAGWRWLSDVELEVSVQRCRACDLWDRARQQEVSGQSHRWRREPRALFSHWGWRSLSARAPSLLWLKAGAGSSSSSRMYYTAILGLFQGTTSNFLFCHLSDVFYIKRDSHYI